VEGSAVSLEVQHAGENTQGKKGIAVPLAMRSSITSLSARRERLLRFAQTPSPTTVSTDAHLISDVRGFQMGSYVVLQVRTRSGLVGYGECNELSSSDLKATNQALAGRAASAYQALDGLVPATMRGGLNIALLDILGKATQAPIYRVLGGPTRNKARAITRLSGTTDEELQSDLQKQRAAGYRAFLIPIVPPAARNQGSVFVHAAAARLQAMRSAAPDADFALEARAQLTPGDAASLAAAVERLHPLWFDEPCPVSNLETIRKISEETVVPLGFGRAISDPGTFQDLLREGLVDLLRPDILTHGITGIRRLAAMAETYYVDVAPWHEGGPIATAAALHAAASIPNFFIAQSPNGGVGATLSDGFFDLPKGPGLGITVDEKTFERNRIA
jgi:galactonate dehydratase